MFPVDQLDRFQVNNPTYRLLKPWWDVCTDFLASAILFIAVLAGTMEATRGNLFCIPAVDCNFERDQSIKASGNNSFCRSYDYSATRNSTMTVLIKLQDRRQYDFVEAECGWKNVHWYASYFPLIIFSQAILLIIVDNFWLKLPKTSSILEHFLTLVIECNNAPGTCLALSNALWGTNIYKDIKEKAVSRDIQQRSYEMQPLLRSTSTDGEPVTSSQLNNNTTSASLEVSEAIKAKTLYEKMRQFRIYVEGKQDWLTLRRIYNFQALARILLCVAFFSFNIRYYCKLNKTVKCYIDEIITKKYNYFKCSNVLVPFFQFTFYTFHILILLYFLSCSVICFWTFIKMNKTYDFKKAHTKNRQPRFGCSQVKGANRVTEDKNSNSTLQFSDISPASGDLAFMLHLLEEYSELFSLRFAIFLSEKNEKSIKDFILRNEWPIEKLQMKTEDGGRTLKLTKLRGIPKTVFEMEDLDSLILENCTLNADDDFDPEDWLKLHGLRSLSLIRCCLTSIPAAILELSSLETLDLSFNNIESIPVAISKLGDLHTLNIANNMVTVGVEHIIAMENLKVLNLRENNNLQLHYPPCQPTLMRLYVNEAMIEKMTDGTKRTLGDVIVKEMFLARHFSVIQYSPDRAAHIEQARKITDKVYKMTSKPKGLALIINIYNYHHIENRVGSEIDVQKLEKLFVGIGYQVTNIPQDSVGTETMFLEKISTLLMENGNCNSLILALMAHGGKDGMYLESGEIVTVEKIIDVLQKGLEEKPKLVFIQSCRSARGIQFNRAESNPLPLYECCVDPDGILNTKKDNTTDAVSAPIQPSTLNVSLPVYSDVLIAYSCLQGHVSYRNTQLGSWFINALVEVFSKYAWEEDVLSLMTYVNYEVSRKLNMNGYKQVPAPQSTLTKKLFFLPGYFEHD